jgi:predicted O-methyltransferase YrrM
MVKRFPSGSSFVEVGVYKGSSLSYLIVEMMNSGKCFSITAIDSFVEQDSSVKILYNNLHNFKDKFKVIIGDSADTAKYFDDKSVDFVFIDASHKYKDVKKDILAWIPKIKDGGVLAGHDYPSYPGVKKAVDEIFGDRFDKNYTNELSWLINL